MAEVIPRGDKKWRIRVFCRRDEAGKKIYCFDRTLIFETVKERNSFVRDIETKHENGLLHVDASVEPMTLDRHLDDWLAHKKPHLEPNTYADYEESLKRYVRANLGAQLLPSLKPFDIQQVYNSMIERGLSARSVESLHAVLSQALEKAVWWERLNSNPASRTERPTVKRGKIDILKPADAVAFLEAARAHRLGTLFAFMLSNGPRPEEAFGLKWADVDLEKGRIEIHRVLKWNRSGGGFRLRDYPKSNAGQRTLTLAPSMIAALQEWRKVQLTERIKAGRKYQHHDLVFSTVTGEPLSPTNVIRRDFRPVLKDAGLPPVRLYALRHSFATLSLAAGEDAKKVSYALGHVSVAFTLDVYCHIVDEIHLFASGKLEGLLFPKKKSG